MFVCVLCCTVLLSGLFLDCNVLFRNFISAPEEAPNTWSETSYNLAKQHVITIRKHVGEPRDHSASLLSLGAFQRDAIWSLALEVSGLERLESLVLHGFWRVALHHGVG